MARRAAMKLDAMTVTELIQLRDEIQTALSGKIQMEREELQAKIDELAKLEAGATVIGTRRRRGAQRGKVNLGNGEAVSGGSGVGKGKSPLVGRRIEPKYRGPNGETWAGRGQAPRWLAELEAKGRKRDSFLIKK